MSRDASRRPPSVRSAPGFVVALAAALASAATVGCRALDEDPYGIGDGAALEAASDAPGGEVGGEVRAPDPAAPRVSGPSVRADALATSSGSGGGALASVDGQAVTADEVLSSLFLTQIEAVFTALEDAITARIVRAEARRLGVTVPESAIDARVAAVLKEQGDAYQLHAGAGASLEAYLRRTFGIAPEAYRRAVRERVTQELFLARVVRYEARQRDRVQVRLMLLDDLGVAREVASKLAEGANFGALAKQLSLDEGRRAAGGLYPPVAADDLHPLFAGAAELPEGAVSAPLPYALEGGRPAVRLLELVRRIPADPRPYDQQRDAVERELDEAPLDTFEIFEWDRRMRARYAVEVGLWRA